MRPSMSVQHHLHKFEGLRLNPYHDGGGVLTVGYGHTGPDVKPGRMISKAQAEAWLAADIREASAIVDKFIERASQEQYDALVCLVFNIGDKAFGRSTLRKMHNAGEYHTAAREFDRWVFDNGRKVEGLINRRRHEKALYLAGSPPA